MYDFRQISTHFTDGSKREAILFLSQLSSSVCFCTFTRAIRRALKRKELKKQSQALLHRTEWIFKFKLENLESVWCFNEQTSSTVPGTQNAGKNSYKRRFEIVLFPRYCNVVVACQRTIYYVTCNAGTFEQTWSCTWQNSLFSWFIVTNREEFFFPLCLATFLNFITVTMYTFYARQMLG